MRMNVEKQSVKFIKPHIPTPETNRNYKLGFTDELALFMNVAIIVFFSPNPNHNNKNSVLQLQKSLAKTLTRFYPLAGRYIDETQIIDCNDEGVEFIHAKVNIKLDEQVIGSKADPNLVNQFVSLKTPMMFKLTNPLLLSVQVTNFECGGVAVGVNASHKIVDASTLCTFLNEWAAINREENNIEFSGPSFTSSLIFPGCGIRLVKPPSMSNDDKTYGGITKKDSGIISYEDMLSKYTRIKRLFSESDISNIREHMVRTSLKSSTRRWSKVQLVGAIFSKASIDVDRAIHKYSRESVVFQAINLRGRFASLIPKDSCGNITAKNATKIGTLDHITTLELANSLSDSIKVTLNNYSKVFHDSKEGKSMVFDSLLETRTVPESTNVISISSWCKFPYYKADFGFGKPIWVAPATLTTQNIICLMDDEGGNGVEVHVFLKVKEIEYFEQALDGAARLCR